MEKKTMEQKIITINMPESYRRAQEDYESRMAELPRRRKRSQKTAFVRALRRSGSLALLILLSILACMLLIFFLAETFKVNAGAVVVDIASASESQEFVTLPTEPVVTEPFVLLDTEEPVEIAESSETNPEILSVPDIAGTDFKTFMDYRRITDKTSDQYAMQAMAQTNELGMRTYNGYPMIALGTYYTEKCGYTVRVYLSTGESFLAVVGDIKDDSDTTETNQVMPNGNVVEFIVDGEIIPSICWKMGDMSYADKQFSGRVTGIEIVENP